MTANDLILIDRGYKRYNPDPRIHRYMSDMFQKRFDDDVGKKYFITVYKYPETIAPNGQLIPEAYECELYLESLNNNCPVQILFYSGWTIEQVEERAEEIFQTGKYDYYERWDEC